MTAACVFRVCCLHVLLVRIVLVPVHWLHRLIDACGADPAGLLSVCYHCLHHGVYRYWVMVTILAIAIALLPMD